eukprot:9477901-Pyramimonas_sp.AAC.1
MEACPANVAQNCGDIRILRHAEFVVLRSHTPGWAEQSATTLAHFKPVAYGGLQVLVTPIAAASATPL